MLIKLKYSIPTCRVKLVFDWHDTKLNSPIYFIPFFGSLACVDGGKHKAKSFVCTKDDSIPDYQSSTTNTWLLELDQLDWSF